MAAWWTTPSASSSLAGYPLRRWRRARGRRRRPRNVIDEEADVADAVAVRADVLGDGAVGAEGARHHEPDPPLLQQVAAPGRGGRSRARRRRRRRSRRPRRGSRRRPGRCPPTTRGGRCLRARGGGRIHQSGAGDRGHRSTPASWSAHRPVPERLHAVEHPAGARRKRLLVEPRLGVGLIELVVGVGGVLVLDLVVPRPEGERQAARTRGPGRPRAQR